MFVVTESKVCGTCQARKPLEMFSRHKGQSDGRQRRCKSCVKAWYAENREAVIARVSDYKAANTDRVLEAKKKYRAENPDKVKAQSRAAYLARADYYRAQTRAARYANPEAHRVSSNEWAEKNPERVRAIKSRYKHKRRALEDASPFKVTARDLARTYERMGRKCTYCHKTFDTFRSAHWDHVVPVSRGGSFGIGNLVPVCVSCNSSKQDKTVTEWRAWQRERAAS